MRRHHISIIALLYVLVMSSYQTAAADSGDDSDRAGRHRDASKSSAEVSVRVLPRPSTAPHRDEDYYGHDDYYGDDDDYYWGRGLPFTGLGQSVTFALEGGVIAILLGSLLVFASTRTGSGRRPGER